MAETFAQYVRRLFSTPATPFEDFKFALEQPGMQEPIFGMLREWAGFTRSPAFAEFVSRLYPAAAALYNSYVARAPAGERPTFVDFLTRAAQGELGPEYGPFADLARYYAMAGPRARGMALDILGQRLKTLRPAPQ